MMGRKRRKRNIYRGFLGIENMRQKDKEEKR